jgi:hypothetical protein
MIKKIYLLIALMALVFVAVPGNAQQLAITDNDDLDRG